MGVFDDVMGCVELGERVFLKGEGEAVKEELKAEARAAGERAAAKVRGEPAPGAEAKPCDKAPPGYKCLGKHDYKGRCMHLEVL